ncbi:hypothetical protein D910_07235 [Dendroctonus ponderosae]|uniref:N-acetyllactosaminide beta-1,3-N-acetylglucosaminyltransferase n=1 Tax=Dendroctonus ponderosae TaxID=77166 RepID=U4UH23_DENPD|nr:hypothetical protein D910_07235 [Dendroctonus ponderosae]
MLLENQKQQQEHLKYKHGLYGIFRFLDNIIPLVDRWRGPISIALYAPGRDLFPTIDAIAYLRNCKSELIRELVSFHIVFEEDQMPKSKVSTNNFLILLECSTRVFLLQLLHNGNVDNRTRLIDAYKDEYDCSMPPPWQEVHDTDMYKTKHELLYPINVVRNVAKLAAQTYFVFPSDIELYPTRNFISLFLNFVQENMDLFRTGNKNVFVLPIFEVMENQHVPENKTELLRMLKKKTAIIFHQSVCIVCHRVVESEKWVRSNETEGLGVFSVGKRTGRYMVWEPFFVCTQKEPLWDERMTWEGQNNKMIQAYTMCVMDYDFHVLDNAFLIHKPGVKKKKVQLVKFQDAVRWSNRLIKNISIELQELYGYSSNCSITTWQAKNGETVEGNLQSQNEQLTLNADSEEKLADGWQDYDARTIQFHCDTKSRNTFLSQRGLYYVIYNFVKAEEEFGCIDSITLSAPGDYRFLDNVIPLVDRWDGPISIALYAPGYDFYTTLDAIAYLRNCGPEHEEMYKSQNELLYPINVARNVAKLAAQTYFIFPSDIELYPTRNFVKLFLQLVNENQELFEEDSRNVFVLPIFEVLENQTVPETKSELLGMLKKKTAIIFHESVCVECHRVVSSEEWVNTPETEGLSVFSVGKRSGRYVVWEPFYVCTQKDPLWDERMTWEGQSNKMVQAYTMCVMDYDFHVLDNAFLIHKPGVKKKKVQMVKYNDIVKNSSKLIKNIAIELQDLYGYNSNCNTSHPPKPKRKKKPATVKLVKTKPKTKL